MAETTKRPSQTMNETTINHSGSVVFDVIRILRNLAHHMHTYLANSEYFGETFFFQASRVIRRCLLMSEMK